MSASDARPIPRRNVAYRVTFPIFDADGDFITGAAGLDSEVSKDGGTFTDCTNEATEIATSSGIYFLDLSASEMDADTVAVIVKTSTSGAKTTPIILYPEESGDLRADVVAISGDATAADNLEAAADGTGYNLGNGSIVAASVTAGVTVATLGANTVTASAVAADAVTELQAGLATAAALQTVDDLVDDLESRLTGTRAANLDNLDAAVSTRLATASYTAPPSAATIADAVLDEALSGHTTGGSAGEAIGRLDAAISTRATPAQVGIEADAALADVGLTTTVTGRIDAAISTRATPAQVNTEADTALADVGLTTTVTGRIDAAISSRLAGAGYTTPPTAGAVADAVWDEARADHTTAGTFGQGAASVQGNVTGSVASVTAAVTVGTNNDKTGYALTAGERDSIAAALLDLANGVETGYTVRGALRLIAAALAGELSGAATTTITIRNLADSKDRIVATVDADGNRTALVLDAS